MTTAANTLQNAQLLLWRLFPSFDFLFQFSLYKLDKGTSGRSVYPQKCDVSLYNVNNADELYFVHGALVFEKIWFQWSLVLLLQLHHQLLLDHKLAILDLTIHTVALFNQVCRYIILIIKMKTLPKPGSASLWQFRGLNGSPTVALLHGSLNKFSAITHQVPNWCSPSSAKTWIIMSGDYLWFKKIYVLNHTLFHTFHTLGSDS